MYKNKKNTATQILLILNLVCMPNIIFGRSSLRTSENQLVKSDVIVVGNEQEHEAPVIRKKDVPKSQKKKSSKKASVPTKEINKIAGFFIISWVGDWSSS